MDSQVHYLPLTPGLFSILVILAVGLIILIQLRILSPRADRISGPEKFCSSARKDFFNSIRQKLPLPLNGCTRARL